jgi:general L-amino acid transport system permease protein
MARSALAVIRRRRPARAPAAVALSLAGTAVLLLPILAGLRWGVVDARFAGSCTAARGACWPFVTAHLGQFLYGYYPEAERWRVDLGILLLAGWCMLVLLPRTPRRPVVFASFILLYPLVWWGLLRGGGGLAQVDESAWGGLFVTLLIAIGAMVLSLPGGALLAIGRASGLPLIRMTCIAAIEFFRGVPLIAILFMAAFLLPFVIPQDIPASLLARVLIANALYASAYMSEVVRGGLQAIPTGQQDAARSLGLRRQQIWSLVLLPQVFRIALPAIVSTFVSLLKDTSLVVIVGVFDLLGIVQVAATDPKWLGYSAEGYAFAGTLYAVMCIGLLRAGAWLETRMAVPFASSTSQGSERRRA